MKELRDYQEKIVENIFNTNDNVLVSAPTGSGKTVMITAVIKKYAELKQKCIFLVPAIDLLAQSKSQFEEAGLKVGIIWKNYDDHNKDVDVYLGTRQTLYRRQYFNDWIKDKIVIVDEAHIGLDRQCTDYVGAKRLIGLTATPEQTDGSSMLKKPVEGRLPGCYDNLIEQCTIKSLTNAGYLAPIQLVQYPENIIKNEVLERYRKLGKADIPDDCMSIPLELANQYIQKNIINKCINENEPAILFFPGVNTACKFYNNLDPLTQSLSAVITANTPSNERQKIYKNVEDGTCLFLINCAVLTTGFDLPKIKNLVLARCVLSKDLFYQIIGRALRPFEGKTAIIYDIFNSYGNIKGTNQSCIESPTWRPEGWIKNAVSVFDRAMENASPHVKKVAKYDYEKALEELISELESAYEIICKKNADMSEGLDQLQQDLDLKTTVVEKVVEKYVKVVPSPQQCLTIFENIDFQDIKHTIARVMRDYYYDCNDQLCSQAVAKKFIMIEVMNALIPETVPELWDDPAYESIVNKITKLCSWWLDNFDFRAKFYKGFSETKINMMKAKIQEINKNSENEESDYIIGEYFIYSHAIEEADKEREARIEVITRMLEADK